MLGHLDQARYVEVGPEGVAPFAYLVALVRLLAVQRVPVLVREDGDRGVAELVDGPESPDGDLAPVGDQHFTHRVERILPGREGRRGRRGRAGPRRPAGPGAGRGRRRGEAGGARAGGAEAGGARPAGRAGAGAGGAGRPPSARGAAGSGTRPSCEISDFRRGSPNWAKFCRNRTSNTPKVGARPEAAPLLRCVLVESS